MALGFLWLICPKERTPVRIKLQRKKMFGTEAILRIE